MTEPNRGAPGQGAVNARRDEARQQRLAEALRHNLSRRKAQSRARETPDAAAPLASVPEKE
jgi:hypothetical protein